MSVPLYCPQPGCGWSYDTSSGKTASDYLAKHLRIVHKDSLGAGQASEQQPRMAAAGGKRAPAKHDDHASAPPPSSRNGSKQSGRAAGAVTQSARPAAKLTAPAVRATVPHSPSICAAVTADAAVARPDPDSEPEALQGPQNGSTAAPAAIRKDAASSGSLTSPGLLGFLTGQATPADLVEMLNDAHTRHLSCLAMAEQARTETVVLRAALESLKAAA